MIFAPASPVDVREFINTYPEFRDGYAQVREHARILFRSAYFELTSRCNLRCEGCFYFDGGYDRTRDESDLDRWREAFAAEARRGVGFVYLVGAEPALAPERLALAAEYFPRGLIGSNGTVPIDPDLPFKIHLSVWGDAETDARLRGADVFRKALRNFGGQERVLVLYTLSPQNIGHAPEIVRQCEDNGLKITFNMFSPTEAYGTRLASGAARESSPFFRVSTPEDNLLWSDEALRQCRETMAGLIDDHPDTVVYSHAYNEWITSPGPLFDVDPETGWATNCLSRTGRALHLYDTSARQAERKCCTSSIDCSTCRLYSGGLASRLRPSVKDIASPEAFRAYLEIADHMAGIYVYDPEGDWTHRSSLRDRARQPGPQIREVTG